ncbi:hypothetical protein OKA04_03035 [Luteolibacter flavescens]|uniref:Uncharacterized protein n=1 Tax=Luteolibacter flavescens TaxID=1859460 RepID=A0ABT3FK72_9BACT|nr:hypothetical protein [Luteolibacter flavescens]MCW1883686.1 hypothetical protein [Luteolibacter flavescens]
MADLCDGRQTEEDVLALVQRTWPPASDPAVATNLRRMVFNAVFMADPLNALQETPTTEEEPGREVAHSLEVLPPEVAIRVLTVHPDLLQGDPNIVYSIYVFHIAKWQDFDPVGCRRALLAVPDESLRTQLLEEYTRREAGR